MLSSREIFNWQDRKTTLVSCRNPNGDCEKLAGYTIKHEAFLDSKRKYRRGQPIATFEELLQQEFVYVFGSIRHIEVVKHLQLATILSMMNRKGIHQAIKKDGGN
jgi:hypothetical protein